MSTLKFWIYQLCRKDIEDDWNNIDKHGNPAQIEVEKIIDEKVVNDCADNICLGGHGKDNKYYQADSYEAYHCSDYFQKKFTIHGLYVNVIHVEVDRKEIKEI